MITEYQTNLKKKIIQFQLILALISSHSNLFVASLCLYKGLTLQMCVMRQL